jgi:hypothetical protein
MAEKGRNDVLKPICVPCHRFFRQIKSGFYFIEGMPVFGNEVKPGLDEPDRWRPYKLWSGDKWKCEGCGVEIISGVGLSPIAEHYQPEFAEMRKKLNADYQVNDC